MAPHEMTLGALRAAYQSGSTTPDAVLREIGAHCRRHVDRNIWIHLLDDEALRPYLDALSRMPIEDKPLWGIPFAIKDNIDLAGIPTTAACEAFSYVPERSAFVVQRLIDAGAIPVGKTNLDQFATGLNGTRSPYGACRNAFDPDYISGGSSSGSAVAVALGLASFSLGSDTAGSGRVPACFNNLVGVKPTRGLLSGQGMVPACRSLDCMSIFALDTRDANALLQIAECHDPVDPYSRNNPYANQARQFGCRAGSLTLGVIPERQLRFFGDTDYAAAYRHTLAQLTRRGIELVEIDYAPFEEAARLLYEGPWVAERHIAVETLLAQQPEALLPVIREIIGPGATARATDLFRAGYRLQALKQVCARQLEAVDALLTPTAGRLFTVAEMLDEPVRRNSELGYYTNFMNLLDLAAVAVPTAFTGAGLPFGVTLVGATFSDRALLSIASRIQAELPLPVGAGETTAAPHALPAVTDTRTVEVAVCGAHLAGLPLNWQLTERDGVLVERTHSAGCYRMYALAGGPPFRPGLIRDAEQGAAIEVEVWRLPTAEFGSFVANIPAPLGIGRLELADGRWVSGFICEPCGIEGAEEITHLGGWRRYLQEKSARH